MRVLKEKGNIFINKLNIILLNIFCVILFGNIHFGILTFFHISLIASASSFFIFRGSLQIRLDEITKSLFIFLFFIGLSYVLNVVYYAKVSEVYYANTGESPSHLYIKIAFSGFFIILSSILAYQWGLWISNSFLYVKFFCLILFYLCLVNAFVDVGNWFWTTGGVIGRYNFDPILSGSPGSSITLSSIGIIIGVAKYEAEKANRQILNLIFISVLLLSILIVVTRLSQVGVVIMFLVYLKISRAKISIRVFSFFLILSFIVFILLYMFSGAGSFEIYGTVNSLDSTDLAVRFSLIQSSIDIFLSHTFIGVGYGMFPGHNINPVVFNSIPVYPSSAHNGLASILAEQGLTGLFLISLITYNVIAHMRKSLNKNRSHPAIKYLAAISAPIFVLISFFFLSNFILFGPPSESSSIYFSFISWIAIGVVVGFKGSINFK